jgi:hypothetical protein
MPSLTAYCSADGTKSVIFEAFETSATCKKVLATEDALQWDFPGQAVAVPYDIYSREDFQQSLSAFLEQASFESIKQFAAITYKACAPLPEIRDTPDPTLVTGALMTLLEVNGAVHDTSVLRKRVRDTVSFYNAHKPWRRSAFYLVLRVAVQRHLYTLFGVDKGKIYYKVILCMVLSKLLHDGLGVIPSEASHCLRQKLGRRLAKLEIDHDRGSNVVKDLHRHIFQTLRPVLEKSLMSAARVVETEWETYKSRTNRVIRYIQQYSSPSDLTLQLPNSGATLNRAMHYRLSAARSELSSAEELLGQYESATALKPYITIMNRYFPIYNYEEQVLNSLSKASDRSDPAECTRIAHEIEAYVFAIGDAYIDYPELKSCQILNLMELWVLMDKHALGCYPILAEYYPGFDACIFDILELSTLKDIERLHIVQSYIAERCRGWCGRGSKTIFDPPAEDSYAVRYYDTSSDATELQGLRRQIEEDADELLVAKEAEWEEKSAVHESKIREMAGLSCVYITEVDEHGYTRQVHKKGCRKHRLKWEAKQISIDIFEYPLPQAEPALKAAVFELMCPKAFGAYRDATWRIISSFMYPIIDPLPEVPLLRAYSGLSEYANSTRSNITLGSSTKSHLDSHYATSHFPIPLRDVRRSLGLKMEYFDNIGKTWISRKEQPSLAHLFPLKLPPQSPYEAFESLGENWPTSNRVLATQTKCPADLNVHEYLAWQGLLLGTHTRWPSLLREMGSTNLNFSTDSTWAIVSTLSLQVGPISSDDRLRDIHVVFRDENFCEKLLEQVDHRLEAIRRNWREPVQLDLLITILLQMTSLTPIAAVRTIAADMLKKAGLIAQGWCASLHLTDQEQESGCSVFAIWAAVLCKRTFYPVLQQDLGHSLELLQDFIVASIRLQNCMVGKFEKLPYNLRNALLRDLKFAYAFRQIIRAAINTDRRAVLEALKTFWPVPAECTGASISMFLAPGSWWTIVLPTIYGTHYIHYNTVRGTLLIDGQQLGMLPSEYRPFPIIQELFGPRNLRTYPSTLPGMSFVVSCHMPFDHWVHLGFRDGTLVIRAVHQDTVLELFNRLLFGNAHHHDLPSPLSEGCYHWLDLTTGTLEIRQQDPWKSKKSNWRLNLRTRQAMRNNGSTLVDPNSELARRVAQNFHLFEYPYYITVYQPPNGKLRIELKRLELDFVVLNNGSLLCPQLGAVIADSSQQDIGTWHGLKSKLVVRSIKDATQRSILLPEGVAVYDRDGPHVSIRIKNAGTYLKFGVDNVLGRVDCPAEPVMLYNRALWHALTSYFLPDSLTGRTGAEESLHYLQSGAYLPWCPISISASSLLLKIAGLSPTRVYYPLNMRAMESVQWDSNLTTVIQDDRYRRTVENILERNSDLLKFASTVVSNNAAGSLCGDVHLENRAISRCIARPSRHDQSYESRDRRIGIPKRSKVAEIAKLITEWSSESVHTTQLASMLERLPIIGGYVRSFDKVQITDLLEIDLGVDWGALVNTAMSWSENEKYHSMFLFSLLALSDDINMSLLRTIASFAFTPDLKKLLFPEAIAYSHFQLNEVPEVDKLITLIEQAKQPYIAENKATIGQLTLRRLDHERRAVEACKILAESFHAQWPSKELDLCQLATVDCMLLDKDEALLHVLPEWSRLVDNFLFSQHIEEMQRVLLRHNVDSKLSPSGVLSESKQTCLYPLRMRGGELPTLPDILQKDILSLASLNSMRSTSTQSAPRVLAGLTNGFRPAARYSSDVQKYNMGKMHKDLSLPSHIKELCSLVAPYKLSSSMMHKRYGVELDHSIKALSDHLLKPVPVQEPFNPTKLSSDLFQAREASNILLNQIRGALCKGDARASWLKACGLWPKMTISTLLTELRSTSGVCFGRGMKEALVNLALAVTSYQRLLRIQDALHKNRLQQLSDERDNMGHTNWSPLERVDWLLLEIDSNIMIRPEQVDVALATIMPKTGQNSVVQLLMGKGKTSCILRRYSGSFVTHMLICTAAMVALVLANEHLFRIVVPRPLLLQSAQIMQSKLGGLLNREVIHIPFSRKTPTNKALMQTYCRLHTHIENQCGIVLALPEHILSFKLSGLQRLCDGKIEEATQMIKAQVWLDQHCRDVLDECDVSLAIRTQLIYPSGSQQTVDGHPFRWQTVQMLLDLVLSYLNDLVSKFPSSIEVVGRTGYPLIYFLRKDVEDYLLMQLAEKISTGQTAILPAGDFPATSHEDIHVFISEPLVGSEITGRITEMFREKRHLVDVLYHLRGLFVHRILLSTFKKRWNVQYGLHPKRDPIAVPYQVSTP